MKRQPGQDRPSRDGGGLAFGGLLHLFALSAVAVAQPILDLLSRHADFFVARQSRPVDLFLLIVVLVLGLPLPLVLTEVLAGRVGERLRRAVHAVFLAVLAALIALPVLGRVDALPPSAAAAAAVASGAVFSLLYARISLLRQYLSVLAIVLVVFPCVFVFHPAVFKIAFPADVRPVPAAAVRHPAPVVMVVLDELPLTSLLDESGGIDPIRYPSFARLAGTATWFRNATAVADDTLKAVPSILTGKYPQPGLQATASDHPGNLFTLLGEAYRFAVFEDYTDLCPPTLCDESPEGSPKRGELGVAGRMGSLLTDLSIVYPHLVLPPKWRARLPSITTNWKNFAGGRRWSARTEGFTSLIDAVHPGAERTLFFVHAGLPHAPYRWYPSGKSYSTTGREPAGEGWQRGRWVDDEWVVLQSYQRHLLQVGFTDALLGELLQRLEETGLYDPSLIVVVADHGGSFRPDDFRRQLTETNFPDIMGVPLLIKRPSQREGHVDDRNVEVIDVLPSIADLLGIELGWPVDGRSVFDGGSPPRAHKICYQGDEEMRFMAASMKERDRTLERMLSVFGSGRVAGGLYKMGPHGARLVGRQVSDLEVTAGDGAQVKLIQPHLFADVDLESDFLPGEITGYVSRGEDIGEPLELAVAVNGVIRATTYTYELDAPARSAAWSALVEDASFRNGRNAVEVFLVSARGDELVLRRPGSLVGSPHLDVNLGVRPVPGVWAQGFWPIEEWGDRGPVRWTRETARLVVPVDPRDPPGALEIDLLWTGPHEVTFQVVVNEQQVFRETFPGTPWPAPRFVETIPLTGVPIGRKVVVELVTEKPPGAAFEDGHVRGVAVAGIRLLRPEAGEAP